MLNTLLYHTKQSSLNHIKPEDCFVCELIVCMQVSMPRNDDYLLKTKKSPHSINGEEEIRRQIMFLFKTFLKSILLYNKKIE